MTAMRDELRHLVDDLPEEQVSAALALVRQLRPEAPSDDWPPSWFGAVSAEQTDTAARAKKILRAEYGRRDHA
jgi:hypothetical protein